MESVTNIGKISEYFSIIQRNIENDNAIGYYNIDRKMEDIVAEILSIIYEVKFFNTNSIRQNYPAIDLANYEEGIAVQVSAVNSASKVERTLEEFVTSKENLKDKYKKLIFFMENDWGEARQNSPPEKCHNPLAG